MNRTYKTLVLVGFALVLPNAAFGQDEEAIDNIVVSGEKSLSTLRRDFVKAEGDFYSLYSKLNDDNEFDVRCRHETPTGQRTRVQVCKPVFFAKARNREDKNRRIDPKTDKVLADKLVILQEKMETLVAANPDLQAAMLRYNTARAELIAHSEGPVNN